MNTLDLGLIAELQSFKIFAPAFPWELTWIVGDAQPLPGGSGWVTSLASDASCPIQFDGTITTSAGSGSSDFPRSLEITLKIYGVMSDGLVNKNVYTTRTYRSSHTDSFASALTATQDFQLDTILFSVRHNDIIALTGDTAKTTSSSSIAWVRGLLTYPARAIGRIIASKTDKYVATKKKNS